MFRCLLRCFHTVFLRPYRYFAVILNIIFSFSFAIRFSLLTDHELNFVKMQFLVKWISP